MSDIDDVLQGIFRGPVNYPISTTEQIVQQADPLSLDIDDLELCQIIDKRIKESQTFYEERYDLKNRRKKNEMYYFGRQVDDKEKRNKLRPYESRTLDNVLYEIEASIKPLAMSKIPDMMVTPGNDTKESHTTAQDISKVVNSDLKKRNTRKVLSMAFKHLPVYFTGVIKVRWDSSIGEHGDYVYEWRHPDNIVVDHLCPSSNADDMSFVAENLEITVQEAFMRFPQKKQELIERLRRHGLCTGPKPTWKDLGSTFKIWEVWSTWYKKTEHVEGEDGEDAWEKVDGVVWKFEDLVLMKLKDPNYDWEGVDKSFIYGNPSDQTTRRETSPEDVITAMATGVMPDVSRETVYNNYFDRPHKPYFFMTYDQWGKQPLDETSRLEQNIRNQENLDERQKQINDTLKNRGKHIFSTDGDLKGSDIERMDMNDPNQDILVSGDVNKVHSFIAPDRPTSQEFNSMEMTRQRMYAISGSSAVRGELQTSVATSNQIAREADFTRADDLVEDTINAASEWMSMWALQFIKLRYSESHMRKIMGGSGSVTFMKLQRDMIEDGMEVMIRSSSTDKLRAQKNALDFAKLGPPFVDPISFFRDMDVSNYEERARMGLMFMSDPAGYQMEYVEGLDTTEKQVAALSGSQSQPETPAQGPQMPTPTDTSAIPVEPPMVPEASPRLL